jgi:hypothetical protein
MTLPIRGRRRKRRLTTLAAGHTDQVDLPTLAGVYRRVHAPDLLDHTHPPVEDSLRWNALIGTMLVRAASR